MSPSSEKRPVSSQLTSAVGVAAVAGAATLAYGVFVERNRFTVRHETAAVLPPGSRPITVLHISDLHMAPWQTAKQDFVRSLARYEPDLIVDTGDNLGHEHGLIGIARALAPFRDVAGVFAHGSNDYIGPMIKNPLTYLTGPSTHNKRGAKLDTAALNRLFETDFGWLSLNNESHAIEIKGSRLEFFGVGDAHRGWDKIAELPDQVDEMRDELGWADDAGPRPVTIGVTHAPYQRVLNTFVSNGADVIFAGHTHGGQVRIPGRPALTANCDIPHEQAQGLSTWSRGGRSAYLNVSAGLGTSIFAPVRFACPPEAVVVTLVGS